LIAKKLLRFFATLLGTVTAAISSQTIAEEQVAIFAGGCFWCMESDFEKLAGVNSVVSGYIGGHVANPSYKQVSAGTTGHTEAVEIKFDDQTISFDQLLAHFWVNIDPLDGGGQFCDRGQQYRSELFYLDESQQQAAQASMAAIASRPQFAGKIQTQLTAATEFYIAEDYHQDYYKKNPTRYNYYRWSCGRDKRLRQLWASE
jgi:peptide-methionine (S)-S-oxide reductase